MHLDGRPVKSCALLAVQLAGAEVTTIEGIAGPDELHPMQAAFKEHHGLQCGFCTPGMVMMGIDIANRHEAPDEATIRGELEGNLCRCTGYHNIVESIAAGAKGDTGLRGRGDVSLRLPPARLARRSQGPISPRARTVGCSPAA